MVLIAECLNGCFKRTIPNHLEKEIKRLEGFHNCSTCLERVILTEVKECGHVVKEEAK